MTFTILSCYFNFNNNPWMQDNTRYCTQQWRKAGARVIFVEIALESEPFVFYPAVDEGDDDTRNIFHKLIQLHVRDIMWYKEMALNIALQQVESTASTDIVAWFDNDVFFVPPPTDTTLGDDWWVQSIEHTFKQTPAISLVQPFSTLVLTTETVRNNLLGLSPIHDTKQTTPETTTEKTDTHEPTNKSMTYEDAIDKCTRMARIRKSIMCDSQQGVTGCMWVARAKHIKACGFFGHSYMSGGDDFLLNVLQGAMSSRALPIVSNDMQRYYFQERGPFARHIMRYRKKWQMQTGIPARCAYLPCTIMHLHHGELEKKNTHVARYTFFHQRHFNATRHVCAHRHHRGAVQWTDGFRQSGVNQFMLTSFERSQTVRDKVLLRMARTQKCLEDMKKQMGVVIGAQSTKNEHTTQNYQNLASVLQHCLKAFDTIDV